MSNCNIFAIFGREFLAGAGFGLGVELNRLASRALFGSTQCPSLFGFGFGFGFNPFCCGNTFYPYFTQMPELRLPDINYNSVMSALDFNPIPANYSSINFMQMSAAPIVNFDTFTRSTSSSSALSTKTKQYTGNLADYNAAKGTKLAAALNSRQTGNTGYCARAVSDALEAAGIGNSSRGDAEDYPSLLANNSNFKEISLDDWQNAPDGAIFWYAPSSQGYSSEHGHVQGVVDGKGISDHIESTLRKPDRIFIPV